MKKIVATSVFLLVLAAGPVSANCNAPQEKTQHNFMSQDQMRQKMQSQHDQMQKKYMAMQEKYAKKCAAMKLWMQKTRESYQKSHPRMDRQHLIQHMQEMKSKAQPQAKTQHFQNNPNQHHKAPCAVHPQKPATPVTLLDNDKDGVANKLDSCPSTPANTEVNTIGCGINENISLNGVQFKTSSDELKKESVAILNRVAVSLTKRSDLKLEVAGHTDAQGDAAANQKLSQKRAEQVRDFLIKKGLKAENLIAKGYGETKLLSKGTTKADHTKNRRVELNLITAEVKAPEIKTPEVKAPEVKAPEIKTPEVKAPEIKTPEVKAPEIKTPEFKEVIKSSPIPTEAVPTDKKKVLDSAVKELTTAPFKKAVNEAASSATETLAPVSKAASEINIDNALDTSILK